MCPGKPRSVRLLTKDFRAPLNINSSLQEGSTHVESHRTVHKTWTDVSSSLAWRQIGSHVMTLMRARLFVLEPALVNAANKTASVYLQIEGSQRWRRWAPHRSLVRAPREQAIDIRTERRLVGDTVAL